MALTKASDVLGLRKKIEEFAVPIDSLSASKVSVDLPGYTATNAAGAFEEIDLDVSQLSASVLTIGEKIENISEYSTDEKIVGKWINGSDLYEKTFDFGALPNASTKQLNHLISNVDNIWIAGGFASNPTSGFTQQLGLPGLTLNDQFTFGVNKTYIQCITNSDRSSYTNCFVTLRYTKTTTQETKKKTTKKRG